MRKANAQTWLRLPLVSRFHNPTFEVLTTNKIHTNAHDKMPRLPRTPSGHPIVRSLQRTQQKGKMKMSNDNHSDRYQSKYIASREASFFNRHRRCIRSSFGAYFVAHTHL